VANSFTQDERGREGSLTTRDPSLDALLDVKQKIEDLDEGTCFDLSQESGSTGSECSDPQFRIGIAGDQYDWHDRRSLPYLLRGRDAVQTFKRDVRHDDGRVQVGRKRDQPLAVGDDGDDVEVLREKFAKGPGHLRVVFSQK